jgi:hypothetical protein
MYICEHFQSGKCDGIFKTSRKGYKCEHSVPHEPECFGAGDCTGPTSCATSEFLNLEIARHCVKVIDNLLPEELFEI